MEGSDGSTDIDLPSNISEIVTEYLKTEAAKGRKK